MVGKSRSRYILHPITIEIAMSIFVRGAKGEITHKWKGYRISKNHRCNRIRTEAG